jgi:hypothetical protein
LQLWTYTPERLLKSQGVDLCLVRDPNSKFVKLGKCDASDALQQWAFDHELQA